MDHPDPSRRRLTPGLELAALAARCPFPASGTAVTCAVSGGADSLALLALAITAGCVATAVHVDHGLRPGSDHEADVVAAAARQLGAGFRSVAVTVPVGPNLEARARQARYAVLPPDVLTGHTADDRAETVLLNMMRGTGLDGLAPLAPGPRRPLVGLRRSDPERVCDLLGFEPVQDPSNLDPVHRRNRVRNELLPLAADVAGRDVVPLLNRQADLLAEVADWLHEVAGAVDPTSARELAAIPVAVARVAIRDWLVQGGVGGGYVVDAAAVERVLDVARGSSVATEVVGGWRVARSRGRLGLQPPSGQR